MSWCVCLFLLLNYPHVKVMDGLPSTSSAGFEWRSSRLLNKNTTTAPHSTRKAY